MKVYDYQWSATFGMSPAAAAAQLAADGVDTALIRNQIDPLPTSASIRRYLPDEALSIAADRAWSDALRAAGRRVSETTALFFDPDLLRSFPDARPIDATAIPIADSTGTSASARRTRDT